MVHGKSWMKSQIIIMMTTDTRNIAITSSEMECARQHDPDGVARLAKFIGSDATDPDALAEACEKHRLMQLLEPPARLRIKTRDSRAK